MTHWNSGLPDQAVCGIRTNDLSGPFIEEALWLTCDKCRENVKDLLRQGISTLTRAKGDEKRIEWWKEILQQVEER